jgi:methionyl-tRNA synthetase
MLWSGVWKALALWKAARNNHLGWYIALIIINTAGILEILYIYVFSKKQKNPATPPTQN